MAPQSDSCETHRGVDRRPEATPAAPDAGEVYRYHLIDPDGTVIDDGWGFYDTDAMRESWWQSLLDNWCDRARTAATCRRERRRQARSAGAGLISVT
ncbi:hypothetical protein [Nocardia testacea]|uniref:hypothetical protein n=1 Tax=Nocardia testacea TaxID=248551 RepID=UPI003A87296C